MKDEEYLGLVMEPELRERIIGDKDKFLRIQGEVNLKQYRSSHSGLSYRQINSLGESSLLPDFRTSDKEWRSFSLKELVYLKIISHLRCYGFKDGQLANLYQVFFSDKYKFDSDLAMVAVLGGIQIIMVIETTMDVYIYSVSAFEYVERTAMSFVNINFNEVVLEIWQRLGNEDVKYRDSYDSVRSRIIRQASERDFQVLEVIRNNNYKSVAIRKQDGGEYILRGESVKEIKESELLGLIRDKKFVDVSVVKRDGKVVSIKVEDSFKI